MRWRSLHTGAEGHKENHCDLTALLVHVLKTETETNQQIIGKIRTVSASADYNNLSIKRYKSHEIIMKAALTDGE